MRFFVFIICLILSGFIGEANANPYYEVRVQVWYDGKTFDSSNHRFAEDVISCGYGNNKSFDSAFSASVMECSKGLEEFVYLGGKGPKEAKKFKDIVFESGNCIIPVKSEPEGHHYSFGYPTYRYTLRCFIPK